jgi:uncharacterized protein Yka (UPF0111/DUF47 family)
MSALDRLFGKDTRFYDLLEAGAAAARAATQELGRLIPRLSNPSDPDLLGGLAQCRRKHKRVSQDTTEALCKTFVTPLEREDIEALSTALYKITKTIEKIGERLTISPPGIQTEQFQRQLKMLENAADLVGEMVRHLRAKSHGEEIRDEYERLQGIEGDADKLMNELLRGLYHGSVDPRVVVFLKDLFELIEKGIDRCRDAASVVFHVALKYS